MIDQWLSNLESMGEEPKPDFYTGIYRYFGWLGQPPFNFDCALGCFSREHTQLMAFGYTFEERDLQKAVATCVMNSRGIGHVEETWGVFSFHSAFTDDGQTRIGVADIVFKPGVMPYRAVRVIYKDAVAYTVQDMSPADDFPVWWPA